MTLTPEEIKEAEDKVVAEKAEADKKTADDKAIADKAEADKAEAEKAEADKKAEDEKNKEYTDFDFGKDVKVGEAEVSEFKAVAKELGLNQEQAQKMVSLQSKFADAQTKANEAQFEKDKDTWKAESMKELGSDSKEKLAQSAKAMDKFGSPELKTLLKDSGLEHRVELVKLLVNVGKAVSEDGFVHGKGTETEKSPGRKLFGDMSKK